MQKIKNLISDVRFRWFLCLLVSCCVSGGTALAAPPWVYQQTILPVTTDTYDLGTTTKEWNNLYVKNLHCTGSGCAGGAGTPGGTQGQVQYNAGSGNFGGVSSTTLIAGTNVSFSGGTPVILGTSPITINATGGSGGSGTVGTSTNETSGSLAYWTTNSATPALLGKIATTTLAGTGPISISNSPVVIGGSAAVVSCATATGSIPGCLSAADWTTFNGKGNGTVTGVTGTYPIISSGGTAPAISLAFGTTTSNTWAGTQTFTNAPILSSLTGILKGNGSSAVSVAANGTDFTLITANTCGAGNHVSAITAAGIITCSADSGGGASSDFTYTTNFGIGAAATSSNAIWGQKSIFASSTSATVPALSASNTTGPAFTTGTGNVGIGTSSPFQALSVQGDTWLNSTRVHAGQSVCSSALAGNGVLGLEYCGNDNTQNGVLIQVANNNSGANAYTGFVTNNDISDLTATHYGGFFENSHGYSYSGFGTGINLPDQVQAIATDNLLTLASGSSTASKAGVNILVGGYNTSNEVARFTAAGRVGIGTSSPTSKLDITSTSTDPTESIFSLREQGTKIGDFASSSINKFGFGTTTSSIALSIEGASTTAGTVQSAYNGLIFSVSGLENTALKIFEVIDQWGRRITGGDPPVLSSCGTSPSFIGSANDNTMSIQVGSVAATGCTATFAHAWPTAPTCNITERTGSVANAFSYTISTTAIVVTQTGLTSDILDVQCTGSQ